MIPLDICGQRLASQHLTKQKIEKASEIVQLLGAVQAQDYSAAKWGIAQRTRSATDAELEKEISDGSILRTHVLRPTWHFVAPADIRWMLALTAPRVKSANAHYDRTLGLNDTVFTHSNAVLAKALQGGKQLTRAELVSVLQLAGIATSDLLQSTYIMMRAELDGIICSGARRGKQFTYALLDERAPQASMLDR